MNAGLTFTDSVICYKELIEKEDATRGKQLQRRRTAKPCTDPSRSRAARGDRRKRVEDGASAEHPRLGHPQPAALPRHCRQRGPRWRHGRWRDRAASGTSSPRRSRRRRPEQGAADGQEGAARLLLRHWVLPGRWPARRAPTTLASAASLSASFGPTVRVPLCPAHTRASLLRALVSHGCLRALPPIRSSRRARPRLGPQGRAVEVLFWGRRFFARVVCALLSEDVAVELRVLRIRKL